MISSDKNSTKNSPNFTEKENRKAHFLELTSDMSFSAKVEWAEFRIKEFLEWCDTNKYSDTLISFSGGKDSTVLMDLVLKVHKKMKSQINLIPAYAIEITFPETIKFIKKTVKKYQQKYPYLKNPYLVPPKASWLKILKDKGYPIFSKQISVMINRLKKSNTKSNLTKWAFGIQETARFKLSPKRLFLLDDDMTCYEDENNNKIQYSFSEKCCDYVKGGLKHDKRPSFVGTMADESLLRKKSWIDNGCNIFNKVHPNSRPLSLWNSNDVWRYIRENNIEVNEAYGYDKKTNNIDNLRFTRLGCSACPFGSTFEELIHSRISTNDELSLDKKYWNRFEKLYEYNNVLYKSQVIQTKIFYILIDMDIKIRNDESYMKIYYERRKRIDEWYNNFRENLLKVMIRVDSNKRNKNGWRYNIDEFNAALKFYKVPKSTNEDEIKVLRKKYSY